MNSTLNAELDQFRTLIKAGGSNEDVVDFLLAFMNKHHMAEAAVHEIYRKVAIGVGNHGDFLKSFAEAVIRADDENFKILLNTAMNLALKYDLLDLANTDPEKEKDVRS